MMVTQAHRQLRLLSPLPADALVFKSMHMTEELGRLFHIDFEFLSDDDSIDHDKVLGYPVAVEINRRYGETRLIDARITSFGFAGSSGRRFVYKATAGPWLWFLSLNSNCRIHIEQGVKKDIKEIVSAIFTLNGFDETRFRFELDRSYPKYEYCVQYRESDFNFVSRLLEREGIYYFFEHSKGGHTLVLTDSQSKHETEPGYEEYPFDAPDERSRRHLEIVDDWQEVRRVKATAAALRDYDFLKPSTDLRTSHEISREHDIADREVYDYPGLYTELSDGRAYVKTRTEELQADQRTFVGHGTLRGVAVGRQFKLTQHPVPSYNTDYLVTKASYTLVADDYESGSEDSDTFECTFHALETTRVFRPACTTPTSFVRGPQTAVVVGKEGEEIDVDEHGRVLVRFHWERYDEPSMRVRVGQLWAGNGWGGMFIPRIGQEVIVDFEEGDPDRPIITGRVYNANQPYPYPPNDNPNISTIRSNSVKGSGFNEFRIDDTAGEEQIFIHAQYNMETRVLHDAKRIVKNDEHEIIEKEERREIRAERHETVHHDVYVSHKDNHHLDIGSNFLIKSGSDAVLTATGAIHLKSSSKAVIEAPRGITLKVGGNFITLDPSGVHIKGAVVNINSGGSAIAGPGTTPEPAKTPDEAEEEVGGEVDPRQNRSAEALIAAARARKPFCAICDA